MYNVHLKRRGCVGSNSCRQYSKIGAVPIEAMTTDLAHNVANTVARQSSATSIVTAAGNVPVSYTGDPNVDANHEPSSHVITEKAGKLGIYLLVGAIGLGALWMFTQR